MSLIISANDDPIAFSAPTSVTVVEGLPANFTVTRGGQRNGVARVTYEIVNGTADSNDYVSVKNSVLQFSDGNSSLPLTISTLDDNQPETDESFTIRLTGVTGTHCLHFWLADVVGHIVCVAGDSVLFGITTVTVTIAANDDASGVIQFSSASLNEMVTEGFVATLM